MKRYAALTAVLRDPSAFAPECETPRPSVRELDRELAERILRRGHGEAVLGRRAA